MTIKNWGATDIIVESLNPEYITNGIEYFAKYL